MDPGRKSKTNLSDHFNQTKSRNPAPSDPLRRKILLSDGGPSQTSTPATSHVKTVCEVPSLSPLEVKAVLEPSISEPVLETSISRESGFSCNEDGLNIESWSLPPSVEEWFKKKGLSNIFEWQKDCLKSEGVLNGKNLVFSAPTSAGKSFVADILMLKQVFENRKKVLLILPFVSIGREKMLTLRSMLKETHLRVGGFMGTHHSKGGIDGVDIAVSTIEKANNIVLKLIQEKTLDKLGGIIVDELHLIGDGSRGHLLELLLSKVLFFSQKMKSEIQIVGMSATLPNLEDLGKWLKAAVFRTNFRPVPLVEKIKIGRTVYEASSMKKVAELTKRMYEEEKDDVIFLAIKTVLEGHGVIIFWNDKGRVEGLAKKISLRMKEVLRGRGSARMKMMKWIDEEKILRRISELKGWRRREEDKLIEVMRTGVGFHHGGLCMEEREIVEDGFREGTVRVLVATSTLSSGVNLPARRVIIRTPCIYGDKMMDVTMYRQMIGRAGRKGIDEMGESFLLCSEREAEIGKKLVASSFQPVTSSLHSVTSSLQPVTSSLHSVASSLHSVTSSVTVTPSLPGHTEPSSSLKRAILEAVVSGLVSSTEEVHQYINSTLMSCERETDSFKNQVIKALDYLVQFKFLTVQNVESSVQNNQTSVQKDETSTVRKNETSTVQKNETSTVQKNETSTVQNVESSVQNNQTSTVQKDRIESTQLGRGVVASSLSPEDGLKLLNELLKARRGFVLNCDLHLLYQIIPASIIRSLKIKMNVMMEIFDNMNETPEFEYCQDVCSVLKINPDTLFCYQVEFVENPVQDADSFKRLFVALALNEIIQERPIVDVETKFHINRGILQSLQNTVSTFASMIAIFCNKLGWYNLELLINHFQSRLEFGVQTELIDLMRIQSLNPILARQLYQANFDTVTTVAHSDPSELLKVFNASKSFEISSLRTQNLVWIESQRRSMTLEEVSKSILFEAREIVEKDVGRSIFWEIDDSTSSASDLSTESSSSRTSNHPFRTSNHSLRNPIPRTPKSVGVKSPRKLMSRKELKKIDREVEKSVRSTSLGEHSISIDPSMIEVLQESPEDEDRNLDKKKNRSGEKNKNRNGEKNKNRNLNKKNSQDSIHSQLTDSSFTPTKSIPSSASSEGEEVIRPKVLFHSDHKRRGKREGEEEERERREEREEKFQSKRSASPSTSFEALRRSKILKVSKSETDSSQEKTSNPFTKQSIKGSIKGSIKPDSKLSKLEAINSKAYQRIAEKWKETGVMSAEFDVKECLPVIAKRIGQNHCGEESKELEDSKEISDGIIYNGGRLKLVRIFLCFGSEEVILVSGRQSLIQLSKVLEQNLKNHAEEQLLIIFDILKVYRIFRECFNIPKKVLFRLKWFDVRIVHWLNDPEGCPKSRRNVLDLVQTYLPDFAPFFHLPDLAPFSRLPDFAPKKKDPLFYSTALLLPLAVRMEEMLDEMDMKEIFESIETTSSLVLAEIESTGIGLDVEGIEATKSRYFKILERMEREAFKLAGKKFNLSSPKEVSNVLFHHLNLLSHCFEIIDKNPVRVEKMKAGKKLPEHLKTSKEMLEKLKPFHPLPGLIAEYRKLSFTIDLMSSLGRFSRTDEHGGHRVCGKIETFMATGRISMENPNIMSATKEFEITSLPKDSLLEDSLPKDSLPKDSLLEDSLPKDSLPKDSLLEDSLPKDSLPKDSLLEDSLPKDSLPKDSLLEGSLPTTFLESRQKIDMRRHLIPRAGYLFLSADYSQVELRLLAHFSNDPSLLHALNGDQDVFRSVAASIHCKEVDEVTDEERSQAKAICYGIVYGVGMKKLSEKLTVSEEEAKEFRNIFLESFPGIESFLKKVVDDCRREEIPHIKTLTGRLRLLPLMNGNSDERAKAERQAINSTIQGSASDLIKLSMVNIERIIQSKELDARLVLQMHDELIFEVRQDLLEEFSQIVSNTMEKTEFSKHKLPIELKVKLTVNLKQGTNWSQMNEFKLQPKS